VAATADLDVPTWNAEPLAELPPWGTVRTPSEAANAATAAELSPEEQAEVGRRAGPLLAALGYTSHPPGRPAVA
jgi:hypothetical protein